jgi:hypothetical protein
MERAWKESEADYSLKLSDLQKKYSQLLYSSKTYQPLELADFEKLSEHLPIFGMIVGGLVYLPQKLEPHTSGKDGSYLPTPTAQDYGTNQGGAAGRTGTVRMSLSSMARKNLWPTPSASMVTLQDWEQAKYSGTDHNRPKYSQINGGPLNPAWVEWLMGYPINHTELSAWVIPWFRSKRKSHSKDLLA